MTQSDLIFKYSLIENLNTNGVKSMDRLNIIKARIKWADVIVPIQEQFEKLQEDPGITNLDDIVNHNKESIIFKQNLNINEVSPFTFDLKFSENTFSIICDNIKDIKEIELDLVTNKIKLSSDEYLNYLFANFVK